MLPLHDDFLFFFSFFGFLFLITLHRDKLLPSARSPNSLPARTSKESFVGKLLKSIKEKIPASGSLVERG